MDTQEALVLKYLKEHKKGLSQVQAAEFNVYDLAGRIHRLRGKGIKIEAERVSVFDERGKERTHYNRYFLVK